MAHQTRCVCCFPDKSGYAIGSIEGRVAIQYIQETPTRKSFAFKCHRNDNDIYAVNSIHFNPVYHSFSTAGKFLSYCDLNNFKVLMDRSIFGIKMQKGDYNNLNLLMHQLLWVNLIEMVQFLDMLFAMIGVKDHLHTNKIMVVIYCYMHALKKR